jgi:hypothetical protein
MTEIKQETFEEWVNSASGIPTKGFTEGDMMNLRRTWNHQQSKINERDASIIQLKEYRDKSMEIIKTTHPLIYIEKARRFTHSEIYKQAKGIK